MPGAPPLCVRCAAAAFVVCLCFGFGYAAATAAHAVQLLAETASSSTLRTTLALSQGCVGVCCCGVQCVTRLSPSSAQGGVRCALSFLPRHLALLACKMYVQPLSANRFVSRNPQQTTHREGMHTTAQLSQIVCMFWQGPTVV